MSWVGSSQATFATGRLQPACPLAANAQWYASVREWGESGQKGSRNFNALRLLIERTLAQAPPPLVRPANAH